MSSSARTWVTRIAVLLVIGLGYWAALRLRPEGLPPYIASGNGRIEAVEIDIAAKTAGRVEEMIAEEGDFVRAGQVLARMDTAVLEAQKREAQAELQRAQMTVETARKEVAQRAAEKAAAQAVVEQRVAEYVAAHKQFLRSRYLAARHVVPLAQLDDDRAEAEAAKAAIAAAKAQVAAAEAAIGRATSGVAETKADVEAARATVQRIEADLEDSILRSPVDGRVQFRVAEPGEVLSPGGVVLNLVDLTDVYMTFFLPTEQAGRVALGAEARIVLDAAPQFVIPAYISFVADVAQFTPKTVETEEERQKLMFRLKARIDPALLRRNIRQVKTGLPGMAYVRLDESKPWPSELRRGEAE